MPEDLKDIDARLHALQQFLKQVCAVLPAFAVFASHGMIRPSRSLAWGDNKLCFSDTNARHSLSSSGRL